MAGLLSFCETTHVISPYDRYGDLSWLSCYALYTSTTGLGGQDGGFLDFPG